MSNIIELKTIRLKLRQWKEADRIPFAQMNADPEVMKYYPSILTQHKSNELLNKLMGLISQQSWGLWAVEMLSENIFIGFVGLHKPTAHLPVYPCVEVGWRLVKTYWGQDYPTEAAKAALQFAFQELLLNEVYSFTSVSNQKSRAVMQRLALINTGNNFDHPTIPEHHPLREHVLYRITKPQWQNTLTGE